MELKNLLRQNFLFKELAVKRLLIGTLQLQLDKVDNNFCDVIKIFIKKFRSLLPVEGAGLNKPFVIKQTAASRIAKAFNYSLRTSRLQHFFQLHVLALKTLGFHFKVVDLMGTEKEKNMKYLTGSVGPAGKFTSPSSNSS